MPSDFAMKTMNAVHRTVLSITGGRVGWKVGTMPVVELTTTGRKSGQPRTVLLTSPVQEGDALIVVASRGGDDKPPAWLLNLQDQPAVQVAVGGQPAKPMLARVANPQERERLWPLVIADHQNYAQYQTRTTREIPLVFLEPVS